MKSIKTENKKHKLSQNGKISFADKCVFLIHTIVHTLQDPLSKHSEKRILTIEKQLFDRYIFIIDRMIEGNKNADYLTLEKLPN